MNISVNHDEIRYSITRFLNSVISHSCGLGCMNYSFEESMNRRIAKEHFDKLNIIAFLNLSSVDKINFSKDVDSIIGFGVKEVTLNLELSNFDLDKDIFFIYEAVKLLKKNDLKVTLNVSSIFKMFTDDIAKGITKLLHEVIKNGINGGADHIVVCDLSHISEVTEMINSLSRKYDYTNFGYSLLADNAIKDIESEVKYIQVIPNNLGPCMVKSVVFCINLKIDQSMLPIFRDFLEPFSMVDIDAPIFGEIHRL